MALQSNISRRSFLRALAGVSVATPFSSENKMVSKLMTLSVVRLVAPVRL